MPNKTPKIFIGLGAAALVLALGFWKYYPSPSSHSSSLEQSDEPAPQEATRETPTPEPSFSLKAQTLEERKMREVTSIDSESQLLEAINETDLFRSSELTHLVERMKSSNAKDVAGYLHAALKEAGDKAPDQRDRIMMIGEAWRSNELLALWQDLALRKTPRTNDEAAALGAAEPTGVSREIQLEILTAISNLGMIGPRSPEAIETLKNIVANPDPKVHSLIVREKAFFALQEADRTASLLVLKSLPAADPLRPRLNRK